MDNNQLSFLKMNFKKYVRSFYNNNEENDNNIFFKEEHTIRTCRIAAELSQALMLDEPDKNLAFAVALLHDIGRFPQFLQYATFNDRRSEDHASLGAKVLLEGNWLSNLSREEADIIIAAVAYHNKYKLPTDISDRKLLHSKIIRDADKLDIFYIMTDDYEKNRFKKNAMPESEAYTPSLMADILNNKNILISDMKCRIDRNLMDLSMIYDLNFKYSLQYFHDKAYLEKMFANMPDIEESQIAYNHVKKYIADKLMKE